MFVDRVYAAISDQADQVDRAVVLFRVVTGAREHRVLEERSVADRFVDAHQVLHHDPTGSEVQMADFAVAHLPLWEADGEPGRVEQRARAPRHQGIPGGRVGQRNRVSFTLRPVSPAIEHYKNHRTLRHYRRV